MYYLYMIRNSIDSSCYVGWTNNLKKRWAQHRSPSQKEHRKHLYQAMKKHGRDSFSITWLEEHVTADSVKRAEIELIAMFRATGVKLYNHSDGGEGLPGYGHTPESKAKISKALKGRKKSPQHVLNMSLVRMGKPTGLKHSEETKRELSKALSGRVFSEVTKLKMSAAQKGKKRSAESIAKQLGTKKAKRKAV